MILASCLAALIQDLDRLLDVDGLAELRYPVHQRVGVEHRHRHVLHPAVLVEDGHAGDIGGDGTAPLALENARPGDVPAGLDDVVGHAALKEGPLPGKLRHAAAQHLAGRDAHVLAVGRVHVLGHRIPVRYVYAVQQTVHHLAVVKAVPDLLLQLAEPVQRLLPAARFKGGPEAAQRFDHCLIVYDSHLLCSLFT